MPEETAEGCADKERRHDFAAFETAAQGHCGEDHLRQERIPDHLSGNCPAHHFTADAQIVLVPHQKRQHPDHTACNQNPHIGIFAALFQQVFRLVEQDAE